MSEPQNQSEGTPLESTAQETSPPQIEVTAAALENPNPVKEDTAPQTSAALPETPAAEERTADATTPVPQGSSISDIRSTDPPMESNVESSTKPTTTNPTDETVPTAVDPRTGVAKSVGQRVKAKLSRIFCCGSKDDVQS